MTWLSDSPQPATTPFTSATSTCWVATDLEVMASAVEGGRVVISADTDFGELLAKGGRTLPSAILLRRHHDPVGQAAAILASMTDIEESLISGAVVVITENRVRIRSLPIG